MPGHRETLLGEAARCRQAAVQALTQDVREGLFELAQRYEELAGKASSEQQPPQFDER